MDHHQLIKRCLNHERSAQKELVALFGGYLMSICRRYIKDRQYSEDVCQIALVRIFQKLHLHDSSKGNIKGWMYKLTVNCALEHLRSKRLTIEEITPTNEPVYDKHSAIDNLIEEDLIRMLDVLNTTQRTIFNLVEIEGYDHKSVAEKLNIKEATSRSHLYRARKILSVKLAALDRAV